MIDIVPCAWIQTRHSFGHNGADTSPLIAVVPCGFRDAHGWDGLHRTESEAWRQDLRGRREAAGARVRDSGTKVVVYRDRNGVFDATCDCTVKPMGCKHCAAVYMDRIGFRPDASADAVRGHIAGFAGTSFDPFDYDIDQNTATTRFCNFMQDKVLDRKIRSIGRTIIGTVRDDAERDELFRELWDSCGRFGSPHDEWSRETIESLFGVSFWEGDD